MKRPARWVQRPARWVRDYDTWSLVSGPAGRELLVWAAKFADGWHVHVYEQRPAGAVYGWIGDVNGLFRTRKLAMAAVRKLLRAMR